MGWLRKYRRNGSGKKDPFLIVMLVLFLIAIIAVAFVSGYLDLFKR